MKNFKKNMFGFAHHALLGVVVVAVISFAGVKVLTGTHALEVPSAGGGFINGKIYSGKYSINPSGSGFNEINAPSDFNGPYSNRSFDGTKIAYYTKSSLQNDAVLEIKIGTISNDSITNTSTIASIPCTNVCYTPYWPLLWSPDGTKIAAAYAGDSASYIRIVRTDGSDSHVVPKIPPLNSLNWLPGSENIMYAPFLFNGDTSRICTISVGGANNVCHNISLDSGDEPSTSLAVSPTGDKVALSASSYNSGTNVTKYSIYTVNPDGSNPKRLASFSAGASVKALIWSPDGTKVAYSTTNSGSNNGLWVMNADGSGKTQISTDTSLVSLSLSWAHK